MSARLEIVEVGGSALVQDLGRPGLSHLGVSPSGAADRGALVRGNRALGNPDGAAGLELIGALRLRALDEMLVAITGATGDVQVDGLAADAQVIAVPAGATLTLAAPRWGLRRYVTVAGGLDVTPVLGSRSADVLSGLGPAPLRPGDELSTLPPTGQVPTTEVSDAVGDAAMVMLDASRGPRADWLENADALYARPWRVSAMADRVGVRMEGEPLVRRTTAELASEGVLTGSIQVPPNGLPVVLGPDHPTTGGYPVVAVLTAAACDALAQARAGTTVRFRRAGAETTAAGTRARPRRP